MTSSLTKLSVFLLLFIFGNFLAAVALAAIIVANGYALDEAMALMEEGMTSLPSNLIRTLVWVQTVASFIIPAIIYFMIYHRKNTAAFLGLKKIPTLGAIGLSIVMMAAGYPLVQASYELNKRLPISDWMSSMEESAMSVMEKILQMDSVWSLITTLLIVGVLPAIGEELAFRGIIQTELRKLVKSDHLGVWLAAMLFSAIHLQFEGFLPRLVLGAILGYLYLWTKSIWVPILIHFLNNGVQVIVLYYSGIDMSSEEMAADPIPWWGLLIATVVLIITSSRLIKITAPHEPLEDPDI